jgi:hypothetical protein
MFFKKTYFILQYFHFTFLNPFYIPRDVSCPFSTLIDLYPNGQITINRNKVDLYQDPMKLGVLLAREKFSEIDLRDDIVDNFLYNFYVFEEYQILMRNIPSDVIPILDELV